MLVMAKRKVEKDAATTPPTQPTGKKPQKRSGKTLNIWLPSELRDQLDAMAEKTRRTVTAEVEIALEEYLGKHGMWPAPAGEPTAN